MFSSKFQLPVKPPTAVGVKVLSSSEISVHWEHVGKEKMIAIRWVQFLSNLKYIIKKAVSSMMFSNVASFNVLCPSDLCDNTIFSVFNMLDIYQLIIMSKVGDFQPT